MHFKRYRILSHLFLCLLTSGICFGASYMSLWYLCLSVGVCGYFFWYLCVSLNVREVIIGAGLSHTVLFDFSVFLSRSYESFFDIFVFCQCFFLSHCVPLGSMISDVCISLKELTFDSLWHICVSLGFSVCLFEISMSVGMSVYLLDIFLGEDVYQYLLDISVFL